jgi:hypothetical protein
MRGCGELLRDALDDVAGLGVLAGPGHVGLGDHADQLLAVDDGQPRTWCSVMVRAISSSGSSAPMVTTSPWASSLTFVVAGSLPAARTFTTMSRSVIMPCSVSPSQIGMEP